MLVKTLKRARRLALSLVGKSVYARPEVKPRTERFGSDYGGWNVAVDGLTKDSVVYSFGIGEDVSFDVSLIAKFGLTIHGFDPTPRSIAWVRQQSLPSGFLFHGFGVADIDGTIQLYPPEDSTHVSHSVLPRVASRQPISAPAKRLATILNELGHANVDILKMDIEGAEYAVIADIARSNVRPRQLLVEFHHRFPGVGTAKTRSALAHIKQMGYKLFAVSESNEEFSFIL